MVAGLLTEVRSGFSEFLGAIFYVRKEGSGLSNGGMDSNSMKRGKERSSLANLEKKRGKQDETKKL